MNRSALIRVPLGWIKGRNLAMKVNPLENTPFEDSKDRQTVEFRSPDGSALVHMLPAGERVEKTLQAMHKDIYSN